MSGPLFECFHGFVLAANPTALPIHTGQVDAVSSPERVEHYRKRFAEQGYEVVAISSVAGVGVEDLIERFARRVFCTE